MARDDGGYGVIANAFWSGVDKLLGNCPAYCDNGIAETRQPDGTVLYEVCKRCKGTGKKEPR